MIKRIQDDLIILFGSLFSAIAIQYLLEQHSFLSGGVSGVALMIQYIMNKYGLHTQVVGYLIFIINIPIFAIGYRFVDREFIYKSLLGVISLSLVFLPILSKMPIKIQIQDPMLVAIYAGVINGFGSGMIMRKHGSHGGVDIIAYALKEYYYMDIGIVLFAFNGFIVVISSLLFGLEKALYTLIFLFISSLIMDKVLAGIDSRKAVFIITDKEEIIVHRIMKEIGRGATILKGQGAYTHYEKKILYTIVSIWQLAKVKYIVKEVDAHAFMSVMDSVEVLGKGFDSNKTKK